jgi:hypothetical protein
MRYNGYFVKTTGTSFKPVFMDLAGLLLCNFRCVTHLYCNSIIRHVRKRNRYFTASPGMFIFTVARAENR